MSALLPEFNLAKVLVIGDVMLDRYWYGSTQRISPEAPVPIVHINTIDERPGGAGNVALNIAALGATANLIGAIGQDDHGKTLQKKLQSAQIACHLHTSQAPTTTKLRIISQHQQLIRLDFEQPYAELAPEIMLALFQQQFHDAKAIILSDYNKGTLRQCAAQLIALARQKRIPILVDPKGSDFSIYRGATLLTPNRKEFELIVGRCSSEDEIVSKGQRLMQDYELENLLITRGEQGMTLLQRGASEVHLPANQHEVYDVTGAGDTVIATLASSIAAGSDIVSATHLANVAAGISVTKLGAATVSTPELQRALAPDHVFSRGVVNEEQLLAAVDAARMRGERVIMTNGCFDILHAGHVSYLEQAKKLGDYLIVAVNTDESVRKLKGPHRPINSVERRMAVLAGLESVDWVVPFSEDTPERLICWILPDVLVKGGDYQPQDIPGYPCVTKSGGEVKVMPFIEGCSTSSIVAKITADHPA